MKLVYFARVRVEIGLSEEVVEIPTDVKDIRALIAWLAARGPAYARALADPARLRAAIDQEIANLDAPLPPDAGEAPEIAFFPPMTGGGT